MQAVQFLVGYKEQVILQYRPLSAIDDDIILTSAIGALVNLILESAAATATTLLGTSPTWPQVLTRASPMLHRWLYTRCTQYNNNCDANGRHKYEHVLIVSSSKLNAKHVFVGLMLSAPDRWSQPSDDDVPGLGYTQ